MRWYSLHPADHPGIHWPNPVETPEMIIDCEWPIAAPARVTHVNKSNNQAKLNCMIIIDNMQDQVAHTSDDKIWHAAVAIDAMCVRRGLSGMAVRVGWEPSKLDPSIYKSIECCGS